MQPVRVGVIGASPGASWAAFTHIPALQSRPEYELRAVSTSRAVSARAAEEAYAVEAHDNAYDLLARDDLDLVVVAVKVPEHRELILKALTNGRMVYSEWPLGVDLAEAEELAAAADSAGVRTVIGLQGRYAPVVVQAAQLVADGAIGDVLATTLVGAGTAWGPTTDRSHAYVYEQRYGATTLTAAAMHALDALAVVLGDPHQVAATTAVRQRDVTLVEDGTQVRVTAADQVAVTGELVDGAVLSAFYRGGTASGESLRWEIIGSAGELLISSTTPGNGNLQAIDLSLSAASTGEALAEVAPSVTGGPAPLAGPADNVARLYAAFARDLDKGTSTVPDFSYALSRHLLAAAIERAASTGRTQTVATIRSLSGDRIS